MFGSQFLTQMNKLVCRRVVGSFALCGEALGSEFRILLQVFISSRQQGEVLDRDSDRQVFEELPCADKATGMALVDPKHNPNLSVRGPNLLRSARQENPLVN